MRIRRWPTRSVSIAAVLLVAACSDSGSPAADEARANSNVAQTSSATEQAASEGADEQQAVPEPAALVALPVREGDRRETTHGVPHIQLDAVPVPDVDTELRRRVYLLPGVEERESELSLPGTSSLWLADDIDIVRSDVLLSGREIAHIHPNGSLHVWLPVDRAKEVAETKWGELHPWVGREDFWDGMAMIYTPESAEDLEVTMRLIVDAYNYITGADLDPAAYP